MNDDIRALARLAIPLAAQQVGFQLMGTVDAAMLGHYSDAALAGAGVGNNLLFGITSVGMGIVMGMDTVVPQAVGAGRTDEARRAVAAGVRLAVLVGLVATFVVFGSPLILRLADVQAEVIHEATSYVYLRAVGTVPFLLAIALRSYLAAHHTTRPLIIAVIVGNLVNAALDLVLIFGVSTIGLPPLGVLGAAAATTIVQVVTVAVYAAGVRAQNAGVPPPPSNPVELARVRAAIVRYGLPVGGQIFAEVGIFGVATVFAAHFGKIPAAAHSIALNLASITFSFAVGIASATSVRVGLAVGANDLALARRRGLLGLRVGFGVMACFAATFLLVPAAVARAFTDRPEVIVAAVPLLQIGALFQLSDGAQSIGAGALRGLGETHATLWGNVIGHYAVGLPLSISLAVGLGLGTPGLWWGLSAGLTVTAVYLVGTFLRSTRARG